MERREMEQEIEERRRVEVKKNLINDAARKQDEPVDDGNLRGGTCLISTHSIVRPPTPQWWPRNLGVR
ncbi:Myosin-VIIa [Lucilia cuprina]|nr:Myosin-VIIa [Lucilia cuprina]